MSITDCILLAVALAMDCFSVGITCGIVEKRFHARQALLMALLFGAFQAAMPVAGWAASVFFSSYVEPFNKWIAFAMLLFVGVRMIRESRSNDYDKTFNPNRFATLLYLAVATSIDALAVGITFACLNLRTIGEIMLYVTIIGAVSFVFTLAGKVAGAAVGRRFDINAGLAGGIILILLGIKIAATG